jgi:ABC-2 type transport system ATP-binding protein
MNSKKTASSRIHQRPPSYPPVSGSLAINVRGLRKRYEDLEAVRGVDLEVRTGEIVAVLGPNGAGKTTILEILEGHRHRDAGEVAVLGFDPARSPRGLRERIGIVPQETAVEPVLTVRETIDLYAAAYPRPRPAGEVMALLDLEPQRDARVSSLSGGQQRRLDLAIAIAGDPELVFLDEPTTGFDPSARRRSWELIRRLGSLGKTIVLTTHYMEEAQRLADRVVVISAGRVVADSTPARLSAGGPALISYRLGGEQIRVETDTPQEELLRLLLWADRHDIRLGGLTVTQPSLEDVYLELTGAEEG